MVAATTWVIDYTPSFESALLAFNQDVDDALIQARTNSVRQKLLRQSDEIEQLIALMENLEQASQPLGMLRPVVDASGNLLLDEYALVSGYCSAYYHVDASNRVCVGHTFIHSP